MGRDQQLVLVKRGRMTMNRSRELCGTVIQVPGHLTSLRSDGDSEKSFASVIQ